jgi:hypothetical protein
MAQDPKTRTGIPVEQMKRHYPKIYSYFSMFQEFLVSRAAYRRYFTESDPFWTMFNIGEYTFSSWKVVWREVANEVDAAVIAPSKVVDKRRSVVPDHTCILVPCDDKDQAHYLSAVLNSSPVRLAIRNYIVLHPDPHILKNVRIPPFSKRDKTHIQLAEMSQAAHTAADKEEKGKVAEIEQEIDRKCCSLWGLSKEELSDINESLIDYGRIGFEWEAAREATKKVKGSLGEEVIRGRKETLEDGN